MEYREFRAMNSKIVLAAEGAPKSTERGFDQAQAFIAGLETRMTRFADTSELSHLNRSAGSWFHASDELFAVICQARDFSSETNGLFDPTILDALENAGYDKSMDDMLEKGISRPSLLHRTKWDTRAIQLETGARAIFLPPGMRLDLGGIAKGWIAERAANELAKHTSACAVSAGGDMFMIGLPADRELWRVELEDPRDPAQGLAILNVGPGAVATSSVTKRRWLQGKRGRHHLIDPRTGEPAETDWLSVTVFAPHATAAEVFAKSLLIAGPREAERLAARHWGLAYIAVDGAGQLWGSNNAKEFLDATIEYAR